MKRMILLTFDPSADVYYPLVELLGKEDVSEVLIPVITRGSIYRDCNQCR
jgi:predicted CopG family antitoxin